MQAQPMMLPQGDFALGMRVNVSDASTSATQGDFATGMRTRPQAFTIASFATGQAAAPTHVIRGTFATGQSGSEHVVHARHPWAHRHEHGHPALGAPALEAGLS